MLRNSPPTARLRCALGAPSRSRKTGGAGPVRAGEGVVQVRAEPARASPGVQAAAGEPFSRRIGCLIKIIGILTIRISCRTGRIHFYAMPNARVIRIVSELTDIFPCGIGIRDRISNRNIVCRYRSGQLRTVVTYLRSHHMACDL